MIDLFEKYNIIISKHQSEQFNLYYEELIDWNKNINLTTITEYKDVIVKHFIDSCLLLSKYSIDDFSNKLIIDVGTGAGFPGIPLAIMMPDTQFTLVDSLNKRIEFLKVIVDKLNLTNVQLVHGRAEDCGKDKNYREQYDYCISRAVADMPLLLEYCSSFIKVNGSLLLYKSKKAKDEVNRSEHALSVLNCKLDKVMELCKEEDYERYLLVVTKSESTPSQYPRKAGIPKKKPL